MWTTENRCRYDRSKLRDPSDLTDDDAVPDLREGVQGESGHVSAAGAYDKRRGYAALEECRARAVIPPRRDAKIWQQGTCAGAPWPRAEHLRALRQKGRRQCKKDSGYQRRRVAETAFFRLKTLFGPPLRSRQFAQQATELLLKVAAVNRRTQLGMPESYRLAT